MKRSQTSLLAFVGLTLAALIATLVAGWHPSLGLDLQGGASVVLQPVSNQKVTGETLDQTIAIIRSRVDALGVAEPEITRQGNAVVVQLPGVKDTTRALKIVGQTAELRFRPVLADLPSEAEAAASATSTTTTKPGTIASKVVTVSSTAKPGAATTTVAGATTTAAGATTTPAPTTTAAAGASTTAAPGSPELAALGSAGRFGSARVASQAATTTAATTATTTATTVAATPTTSAAGAAPTTTTNRIAGSTTTVAGAAGAATTTVPAATTATTAPPITDFSKTTSIEDDKKDATVILPVGERSAKAQRLLLGPAELTGDVVSDAFADISQSSGWETVVKFDSKGSALWDAMATKYYQQRIAIVLDGVVYSAPVIQAQKFNGTATISGTGTTPQQAKDLATALKYGALPVQLKPATVQTVSATLGRDSLHAGLLTGGLGLLLVAAYMVFYYKRLGLIVVAGLCMSASLMWVLVSWLSEQQGLALSLSGAVGIIVSVGITVDSYVVYFERLHDEIRAGRAMSASVDRAFKGAWRTILAADLTSLIGAAALYFLTVGSVRGFALFLAMSTLLDMIVAYFFTRPLVSILGRRGSLGGPAAASKGGSRPLEPSGGGGGQRLRPSKPGTVTNTVTANAGGQS